MLAAALPNAALAVVRADPGAPPGAAADWLPPDRWVGERWLPFDEELLERKLRMSSADVVAHLNATGDSVAQLARRRGVRTTGLAAALVARSAVGGSPHLRRVLRGRARRVLAQSHLAAHMLGHNFHLRSITLRVQPFFGVTQERFELLFRTRHATLADIAAEGGVGLAQLRTRVLAQARATRRAAVARGEMSRRENALLRSREVAGFGWWVAYRVPTPTTSARAALCQLPAA